MNTEKKRLIVFIIVAYGVTFLMGIPMYIGFQNGFDLSCFPSAQMMYPAAGVALGLLLYGEKDKVPKGFMISILTITVLLMILAILSIGMHKNPITLIGSQMDVYYLIANYVIMLGSIIVWIFYFLAGKERREAVGLGRKNWGKAAIMVVLFVVLYILRILLCTLIDAVIHQTGSQGFQELLAVYKDPMVWMSIVLLPINYLISFLVFFGEEYGWRYYLQGELQKKFGMRLGVILLGLFWGLWHLPIDLMYYTKDSGIQMLISQLVTCVALAIFFGYAYLKTNNIWVPVCIHYLNNNLIPIISGNMSTDVLENQHVEWMDIAISLVADLVVFCIFLFAKEYREKKEDRE